MRDGVHRERDAILHPHFAHQLGDVGFHRALFNAQSRPDLLVGTAGHQHLQHFFFRSESAMRFCTPTLRINLATWAFTVRSSMPRAAPISLLERPATSISSTSFSRSVKVTRPAGKMRPGE